MPENLDLDLDLSEFDDPSAPSDELAGFDELLAKIAREGKKKKASHTALFDAPPPPPPAPKWKPVARTLRILRQTCSCGCEHTFQQGVFLEEVAPNRPGNARRFTSLASHCLTDEIFALPQRIEMSYETVDYCHLCFSFEDVVRRMGPKQPSPQLSLSFH